MCDDRARRLLDGARAQQQADPTRPGGLIVAGCAAFLGYSLFFDGKTPEEQQRHLWGLGAGVVGYLYGPETLKQLRTLRIPQARAEQAVELYGKGAALTGAAIGGVTGYLYGPSWFGKPQGALQAGPADSPDNTGNTSTTAGR
jgi:hypothetical protein